MYLKDQYCLPGNVGYDSKPLMPVHDWFHRRDIVGTIKAFKTSYPQKTLWAGRVRKDNEAVVHETKILNK